MDRIETINAPKSNKGIIIYYADYPNNGSWPNRIKNFSKIFELLRIDYKIVVPYPPLYEENKNIGDEHVVRLQKTRHKRNNFLKEIFLYFKGILKSYKYVRNQKQLDFVLFTGGSYATCYPILRICKRKSIKVWIDIVDENSKKFETHKSIRDYLAIFNKDLFDKWLIPRFDKVFVISDFLWNKYKSISHNINIQKSVPSLIDLIEFDKNSARDISSKNPELYQLLNDNRLKLLYAGSVERPNGILFVLDCAAELITQQQYDFLIVIIFLIGDKEKILQHAKKLGIEKNLLLLCRQDQIDLPAIYKQSDILFLPEHGSIIANAGFPGKTAELLASGKPIISTIFSDIEKYLINGENALLSPIGDTVTYTSNLNKLLDDSTLRNRIGANGRITAENEFDYKSYAVMFADLASVNLLN